MGTGRPAQAPSPDPPRLQRRRFFLTSLGGLLWRGVATLLGIALLAGLAGELWLRPGPLFRSEVGPSATLRHPITTYDVDGDGSRDWISQSNNPLYGASLVVNMQPGIGGSRSADRQIYFPGSKTTPILDVAGDGRIGRMFVTSLADSAVWLTVRGWESSSGDAPWDTMLFKGGDAPLRGNAFPMISHLPIPFPTSTNWLVPVWGNFQAWRGALILDPADRHEIQKLPLGVGLGHVDSLALDTAPGTSRRLFGWGCGSNNGNRLGGVEDTGTWLFLFHADSGLVFKRQLPGWKSARAAVFPDRRHVLITVGQFYEEASNHSNLLIWDSFTDSMVWRGSAALKHPTQPVRRNGRLVWHDLDGRLWEATPVNPRSRGLGHLPGGEGAMVRPCEAGWLVWDGTSLTLADHFSGRKLLMVPVGAQGGRAWFDFEHSTGDPRRMILLMPSLLSSELGELASFELHHVGLPTRWLRHPFVPWSLIPGSLAFLLLLGVRMFTQENLLRRLVPRQGQAVALLDAQGRLVYANDLFEEILRETGERLPVCGEDGQDGETRHGERRLRWRTRLVPRRWGRPWRHLLGEDVTHQRENEQQRLFLMKLAVMAHDLKAPLTPLRLQAESIEDALPLLPPAVAERVTCSLAEIDRQVERSLQLITRFMGMARTEFECGPVALPDLARAALRDLAEQSWPALTTRLEVDPGRTYVALAEGEVLQLALFELLQNAAQAMGGRGDLVVQLHGGQAGVAITVRDQGPGIPSVDLKRVLEPGYSTRSRGTGFGLYFVSRVVERMGGRLELANRPEGGLDVRLELPAAEAAT